MAGNFFLPVIKNFAAYKFIILTGLLNVVSDAFASSLLISGNSQKKGNTQTCHPPKPVKKFIVSGKVTQAFPYCGGAKPTKEILERSANPVAFANKKFYVRPGKINSLNAKIVKSFITDSSGFFSIQLQPGTYAIIVEEQLYKIKEEDYKKQNQKVDIKCLREWWAKPYYLLKVENNNIVDLKFNFQHRCLVNSDIPCISYNGPLRP